MGYGGTSDGGIADIISLGDQPPRDERAELPANDAAWQKAITFLQRTQNNKETNDQKFTADDGGFIYYPGYSQIEGTTQSYGAHLRRPLSYRGPTCRKTIAAWSTPSSGSASTTRWTRTPASARRRSTTTHGVRQGAAGVGEPVITDSKGGKHNWREELAAKMIAAAR